MSTTTHHKDPNYIKTDSSQWGRPPYRAAQRRLQKPGAAGHALLVPSRVLTLLFFPTSEAVSYAPAPLLPEGRPWMRTLRMARHLPRPHFEASSSQRGASTANAPESISRRCRRLACWEGGPPRRNRHSCVHHRTPRAHSRVCTITCHMHTHARHGALLPPTPHGPEGIHGASKRRCEGHAERILVELGRGRLAGRGACRQPRPQSVRDSMGIVRRTWARPDVSPSWCFGT